MSTHLNVIHFTVLDVNEFFVSERDTSFLLSKSYRSTEPSFRPAARRNSNGWNWMHVTGDACSWNSMIRCWVRMSHMITDPVNDALSVWEDIEIQEIYRYGYLPFQPMLSKSRLAKIWRNLCWQCDRDICICIDCPCAHPTAERLCHYYQTPHIHRTDGNLAFGHFSYDRKMLKNRFGHSGPIV